MYKNISVVVVKDDVTVLAIITDYLRKRGYQVEGFADGLNAQKALVSIHPDVVILDRIDGLEYDADDYLTKPFVLRELQLRIDAMIRRIRSTEVSSRPFHVGPFTVNPAHRRILFDGNEMTLTTREYKPFLFLLENPDRILSRNDILNGVWGWNFGDAPTVTVHVRRLREKIEPILRSPRYLLTEGGQGYRFTVQGVT